MTNNLISSVGKLLFSYNYSLVCAFFAWICAQLLKIVFVYFTEKRFHLELFFSSGGMPSAHSASVAALAFSIGRECGMNSPSFSIAAILAAIVMYDSTGVRKSSGEQAKILNRVVEILDLDEVKSEDCKKKLKIFNKTNRLEDFENYGEEHSKILKESLGHTTTEVLGGALLGLFVVLVVPF